MQRDIQRNDNIKVTPCDGVGNSSSVRWCCGPSNACCADGIDLPIYTIARRFGDPIPTASLSISSLPPASTTFSSSSAMFPIPSTSSSVPIQGNFSLSTGAKAGIGVGVALGVIALTALGVFIYKALQWRKTAYAATPPYSTPEGYNPHMPFEAYQCQQELKPAQLGGVEIHEMSSSQNTSDALVAHVVDVFPDDATPLDSSSNDHLP